MGDTAIKRWALVYIKYISLASGVLYLCWLVYYGLHVTPTGRRFEIDFVALGGMGMLAGWLQILGLGNSTRSMLYQREHYYLYSVAWSYLRRAAIQHIASIGLLLFSMYGVYTLSRTLYLTL